MESFISKSYLKFNVKGGILSPGALRDIIEVANNFRIDSLYLGERQNIYLRTFITSKELLRFRKNFEALDFEINRDEHPNIISSYVAEEIFTSSHNWLSEGIYKDVLDGFDYKPRLKINIVDNTQGLVPLFTGNLNFISSQQPNFWYLYVQHSSLQGIQCWPELVYTEDIPLLAKALEVELVVNKTLGEDLGQLKKILYANIKLNAIPIKEELTLPRLRFPMYEGMNKQGEYYWLGIYRRSNDFSVEFLEKVADLCMQTKIGSLYITPFKSLLIKGIKEEDRFKWEKLLGKYGINIRHSIAELNWKTPDLDDHALRLKNEWARELDSLDVRTFGLTFVIKSKQVETAASVMIEKKYEVNLFGWIKLLPRYTISYVPDFNPNRQEFKVFVSKRPGFMVSDDLQYLCKKYYDQLAQDQESTVVIEKIEAEGQLVQEKKIYACQECFTVYDESVGDSTQQIVQGTLFSDLPKEWHCPVCEASKESFRQKKKEGAKVLA